MGSGRPLLYSLKNWLSWSGLSMVILTIPIIPSQLMKLFISQSATFTVFKRHVIISGIPLTSISAAFILFCLKNDNISAGFLFYFRCYYIYILIGNCRAGNTCSDVVLRISWPEIWRVLCQRQLNKMVIMLSGRFCSYRIFQFCGTTWLAITHMLGSVDIKL